MPPKCPKEICGEAAQTLFFDKCLLQHFGPDFVPLRVIRTAQSEAQTNKNR